MDESSDSTTFVSFNDDVLMAKIDGKTKPTMKMTSGTEKIKDASMAVKELVADPSPADEVISIPTTFKITTFNICDRCSSKILSETILESLKGQNKRSGASVEEIGSHINENCRSKVEISMCLIREVLQKFEESGVLEKTVGANVEEKFKMKKTKDISTLEKELSLSASSDVISTFITDKSTTFILCRSCSLKVHSEAVLVSLKALDQCSGASVEQIGTHVKENCRCSMEISAYHIHEVLKLGEESGVFEKIVGASGEERFKIA